MDVLRTELNLIIDDFDEDPTKSEAIRNYHDLLADYMARRGSACAIHIKGEFTSLYQ